MAIKNLLAPLGEHELDGVLIDNALAVARLLEAHLVGLHVTRPPEELIPYATIGLSAGMRATVIEGASQVSREVAARLRERFEAACASAGVALTERPAGGGGRGASAEWMERSGKQSVVVSRYGRVADLIVVSHIRRRPPPPPTIEAALLDTGRPLLLMPATPHGCALDHVAIAWNGSKEASQAVAAAGPCLAAAKRITVLTTRRRMGMPPSAEDLERYLGWHGLGCEVRLIDADRGSRRVARGLLEACAELGADLLVMGAYGRVRAREMVFGDVTRYVFARAELPVLMVH